MTSEMTGNEIKFVIQIEHHNLQSVIVVAQYFGISTRSVEKIQ
jgi:hypothetical protein